MAKPSTWSIYQYGKPEGDLPAYFCFRPPVQTPWQLPAALVNPVFARFLDRARSSITSLGECEAASVCARGLVTAMALYFENESDRREIVTSILEEFLGLPLAQLTFTGADSKRSARVGTHPAAGCFCRCTCEPAQLHAS